MKFILVAIILIASFGLIVFLSGRQYDKDLELDFIKETGKTWDQASL